MAEERKTFTENFAEMTQGTNAAGDRLADYPAKL